MSVMSLKRGRAARRRACTLPFNFFEALCAAKSRASSSEVLIDRDRRADTRKAGIRHLRSAIRGLYLWRIEMSQVKSLAFSAKFVVSINTITLVPGPINL